jgi:hypothetical protein
MQRKPLIAAALAAAFAFPLAATAGSTEKHASTDKQASATTAKGANDGGAEAMFKSMDKNGDGVISKEEASGTPHAANFDQLDKNHDGKLSRAEHANAPEHVAGRSGAKAKTASADTSSGSKKTY